MKILFVSANRSEINMRTVPLGMAGVAAAAAAAGREVKVLDLMTAADPFADLARAIAEFGPEVIGVSLRNIDNQAMVNPLPLVEEDRRVIQRCRQLSGAVIVLGGAGYSIFPQSALDYSGADYGIQGEGETAFTALLDRLAAGKTPDDVPGLFQRGGGPMTKRTFAPDLDQIPLPDPDLFATSAMTGDNLWFPVQTRRGCPLGCSYCSTSAIEGTVIRKRRPDQVVRWLAQLHDRGVSRFFFVDNTFNLPRSYALDLCHELARAGLDLKWRCIVYPYKLDDDLAQAMARAGCIEASIGFESGSEPILINMNKRYRQSDISRTFELLGAHGIRRMGFLLLGGPGETRQTVAESLDFAETLRPDFLKITIGVRIYPFTDLARQAAAEGVLAPDDDLLMPRFYLAPGLEDWLVDTVKQRTQGRPNWVMDR